MPRDNWPTTHISLLLRVKDPQSDAAWSEFVTSYQPLIVELIRDVFRLQACEADDVAQEVLIKVVRTMRTFRYDPDKRFRAWLRTVTRNAVRDAFRMRQREVSASGDSRIQQLLDAHPDSADSLSNELTQALHRDLLSEAERLVCQRVEPHTWQAYTALKLEQVPARDVANQLRMSVAAVYKAKSKVVRMLREEVAMILSVQ